MVEGTLFGCSRLSSQETLPLVRASVCRTDLVRELLSDGGKRGGGGLQEFG